MRTDSRNSFQPADLDPTRTDTILLGRLGRELVGIYRDTLDAPLPGGLQTILARMEAATRASPNGDRGQAQH